MNTVLVCMIYGFGMPILFPLTWCFLILTYIFHKIYLVKFYRPPPMYDNTLNSYFIYYVKYGGLFCTGIAYWFITNRQMFFNENSPIYQNGDPELVEHNMFADH